MDKHSNFFVNLITSGKSFNRTDEASMDMQIRYILLNFLIFMGGSLLFIFAFENLRRGLTVLSIADFMMGSMTIIGFIVLRTNAPFVISGLFTVVPFMVLCGFFAQSGGAQGSGVLWSYSFPMMAIFLLGMRMGIALSLVLLGFLASCVFLPGFAAMEFERSFALRTVAVYTLVLACTVVYEQTKITKDKWLIKLTRALQSERDEVSAMKDNLNVGLFLLNQDHIIQPQYSKALEDILSDSNLSGRSVLDLLSSSIQQKERETLVDYFSMVFNRSYDQQMLDDINPLHEFAYVQGVGGVRKILKATFIPIDREDGKVYILASLTDRTKEVELEAQLSAEENKREEEMHALFEVIHVEPRVLNDFIEDTEYEFDKINTLLKDSRKSAHDVMVEIYQCVHAIKSNAVILGLKNFATKLHGLEDKIRLLREKYDVSFEEILHITVELDRLMKIKDSYKILIEKILSFNVGDNRMQEEQVLVQTLSRVVDKASEDLGKKARLVVGTIDSQAISNGPRRAMKEILTQLIRNAIYHGIENPDSRRSNGKAEAGSINLSIEMSDGKILIQLTDDGKGLDFKAIKAKAEKLNLITDVSQLDSKSALTQVLFTPGFSTAEKADLYAGRGVGLSLVRDRIKELKGSIKLQSEEGKGTVFRIYLPVEITFTHSTHAV